MDNSADVDTGQWIIKWSLTCLMVIIVVISSYMCVDRVCEAYETNSNNALTFRALELGYVGRLDLSELFEGD